MKHGIIFIVLTVLAAGANAQLRSENQYLEGYRDGLIVTQANDTIMCQVPVAINFGDKVSIKRTTDGPAELMPISNIKYLATATNVYENISFQTAVSTMHKLMWLEVEGPPLNLYVEITRIEGASSTVVIQES